VATVLRYAWAGPATLLGLALATLAWRRGGMRLVHGVVEAHGPRLAWALDHLLPIRAAAVTLGHVVLGRDARALEATRRHERVHVRQYERWGPLFLPAYMVASAWARARGDHFYFDNAFEREARARDTITAGRETGLEIATDRLRTALCWGRPGERPELSGYRGRADVAFGSGTVGGSLARLPRPAGRRRVLGALRVLLVVAAPFVLSFVLVAPGDPGALLEPAAWHGAVGGRAHARPPRPPGALGILTHASSTTITGVLPASPAAQAGLRRGDVLCGLDEQAVTDPTQIPHLLSSRQPGEDVVVDVERNGKRLRIRVTLAAPPHDGP
jgi:hypothetical protein